MCFRIASLLVRIWLFIQIGNVITSESAANQNKTVKMETSCICTCTIPCEFFGSGKELCFKLIMYVFWTLV